MAVLIIVKRRDGEDYLLNTVNYLLRRDKNTKGLFGGYGFVHVPDPYQIAMQFQTVAGMYAKRGPLLPRHFILSFTPDAMCDAEYFIKPYEAALIAEHICLHHFQQYQRMYGVHDDESHLHIHFLVNPVSLCDGHMLNWSYEEQYKLWDTVWLVLRQPDKWKGTLPIYLESSVMLKEEEF